MYQHERIKGVNVCIVVIYLYQWLAVISFVSCGFVHCSCCSISDDARRSGDRYRRRDYNCTVRGVYHSTVPSRAQYDMRYEGILIYVVSLLLPGRW